MKHTDGQRQDQPTTVAGKSYHETVTDGSSRKQGRACERKRRDKKTSRKEGHHCEIEFVSLSHYAKMKVNSDMEGKGRI